MAQCFDAAVELTALIDIFRQLLSSMKQKKPKNRWRMAYLMPLIFQVYQKLCKQCALWWANIKQFTLSYLLS